MNIVTQIISQHNVTYQIVARGIVHDSFLHLIHVNLKKSSLM